MKSRMAEAPDSNQDREYLKKLCVLYVEDEQDAHEQFCQFLSRLAGRLVTARNGAEGLQAYLDYQPDILITDIQMPVMNGLDMAAEIRRYDSSLPVIVLTAFEQSDYLMRAIELDVDVYVTKPVNSLRLHNALLKCAHRLLAEKKLLERHELEKETLRRNHSEAIGILAGGLAHDFNNLLQALLGSVSLAKMHIKPSDEAYKYLSSTEEFYTLANELGQRLLMLTKGSESRFLPLSLPLLVNSALENVFDGSGITVKSSFPENTPVVRCDSREITEVFSYLAVNSKEAMPCGGMLRVNADVVRMEEGNVLILEPGDYVHISFRDSGHGIPADILPKIFNPYFTTKERGSLKGTGLSLTICETIIKKHHGRILAESPAEGGAIFHIYLPANNGENTGR